MKKYLLIILALIVGISTSCKKNTVEPSAEPEVSDTIHKHSLVYIAAVEPTDTTNGCVAHYYCESCGGAFADAQGTEPLDEVILWANEIAFDTDNISEYFDDYSGDTCYMQQIAYSITNEDSDEGCLWHDYSGWRNWTDEQWEEYWNAMYDYLNQLSAVPEKEKGPRTFDFGSYFVTRILNKQLDFIDENIASIFDGDDINKKLEEVMSKLNEIQGNIKRLAEIMHDDNVKFVMQERVDRELMISNATDGDFRAAMKIIKGRKLSTLPPETINKIKSIVNNWEKKVVFGNNIISSYMFMLQNFHGNIVADKTYPQVYDHIAYCTIGWEHNGYAFREMTRATDVITMTECYVMTILYYHFNGGEEANKINRDKINYWMLSYFKVLNDNAVKYRREYRICQIPGARMAFKKEFKDLDAYSWMKNNPNAYWTGAMDIVQTTINNMLKDINGGQELVKSDIYKTIYAYYYKKGGKGGIYDMFVEEGFTNISPSGPAYILSDKDVKWSWDDNIGNYRCVRWKATTSKGDWISFSCTSSDCGGIKFLENKIAEDMRIANGVNDHNIQDFGRQTEYRFRGLTTVKLD